MYKLSTFGLVFFSVILDHSVGCITNPSSPFRRGQLPQKVPTPDFDL